MVSLERLTGMLKKTPVILHSIVGGVSDDLAHGPTDGPEGWTVIEVLCHLYDFEEIFYQRVTQLVETENPVFAIYNNAELAKAHDYSGQQISPIREELLKRRAKFLVLVGGLPPEQWERKGTHPVYGEMNLFDLITHVCLHDTEHTEQIVRILGLSAPLF